MSERLTEGLIRRFLGAIGLGGRGSAVDPDAPQNKVGANDGHRGMAFGRVGGGKEDLSADNRKKWERLGDKEAADFVYNGSILFVHSSNVLSAQYTIESRQLLIAYKAKGKHPGGVYLYSQVSEDEAIGFAQSMSKGTWVWDNLRIRGSATGHKKPYVRIA